MKAVLQPTISVFSTDWKTKVMHLDEVIGLCLVLLFISLASDGYHEDQRSHHNDIKLDCRAPDFGRSSDDILHQDCYQHDSNDRVAIRSLTTNLTPLILTPYITRKQFQQGINAAKVKTMEAEIESYSGFFEVNNRRKSFMFFWYFSPLSKEYIGKRDTPVIMWIQGGMGETSLFAALRENGPIRLELNGEMVFNELSWAEKAHLVYFDSPVGVGYSFTESGKYPTTQEEMVTDLYVALKQYLRLFGLIQNPFFIAGQGYAGGTVAALGALIHKKKAAFPVNFQGVAIGNGFVDPPSLLQYGKFLYQLGFIDGETRHELRTVKEEIQAFVKRNMEAEAMDVYSKFIQDTLNSSFIDRKTALASKLDFTQVRRGNEEELLRKYLEAYPIHSILHATHTPFVHENPAVLTAIWPDLMKSQVHNLKVLMNRYRVLLYHGQMSVINAYPLVLECLKKLRWRGGRRYRRAERVQWRVHGYLAGYFKKGGRFTELLMRNAGCRVSADQPKWALHMINKFIFDEDFNSK